MALGCDAGVLSQARKAKPYPEGSGEPFKDFKRECDTILFAFWGGFGYVVESRLECWLEGGITGRGSNLGWKRQYSRSDGSGPGTWQE